MLKPTLIIERADASNVDVALPLLIVQMQEHHVRVESMRGGKEGFYEAVRGLVDPKKKRGAVILARDAHTGPALGVAVLAYTWTIEVGGPCAWLDELYVIPEIRGQGLGTLLLHHAMLAARGDGCLALDLEVDANHARAESLYDREGFTRLSRNRFQKRLL
jgi:GNAT superfamily N-acetyltransferase